MANPVTAAPPADQTPTTTVAVPPANKDAPPAKAGGFLSADPVGAAMAGGVHVTLCAPAANSFPAGKSRDFTGYRNGALAMYRRIAAGGVTVSRDWGHA